MVEIWKDAYGFEKYLKVSDKGRVYRKPRRLKGTGKGNRLWSKGMLAKTSLNEIGYEILSISIDGKKYNERVHRLVLQTFRPHKNFGEMDVNHKDGVKTNNNLENLEWMTHKENIRHAWKTGLMGEIKPKEFGNCAECDNRFEKLKRVSKYCSVECSNKGDRKVKNRPTSEELYDLLKGNPFTKVGEMYGVSDNAVRKWCKSYGIPTKSSYYRKYK